jgi:pantoate kinase
VHGAFSRGEPCPGCGLSASAAAELLAARARGAEFSLVVSAAQAECRAQAAEREAVRLREILGRARRVLAEVTG